MLTMTNTYYRIRYWIIRAYCRMFVRHYKGAIDVRETTALFKCDPYGRELMEQARRDLLARYGE